jgi:hypothetical protein
MGALPAAIAHLGPCRREVTRSCWAAHPAGTVAGSCSSAGFCGDGDLASGRAAGCAGAAVAGVPAVCAGSAGFISGDPVATVASNPPVRRLLYPPGDWHAVLVRCNKLSARQVISGRPLAPAGGSTAGACELCRCVHGRASPAPEPVLLIRRGLPPLLPHLRTPSLVRSARTSVWHMRTIGFARERRVDRSASSHLRRLRQRDSIQADMGNRISGRLTMDANTIALAWFSTPTAYRSARRLMSDGWQWPPSYRKWRESAERTAQRLMAAGRKIVLIDLEPGMFRAWCRAHGHDRDGQARRAFVAMLVRARQATGAR